MRLFIITSIIFPTLLMADYGWIPKPKVFFLRAGVNHYSTDENHNSIGELETNRFQHHLTKLQMISFFIESEYGLGEQSAAGLKTFFHSSSAIRTTDNFKLLNSSGLGDLELWYKYRFRKSKPLLTLEARLKMNLYQGKPNQPTDLFPGDGNIDFGVKLHSAIKLSRRFFLVGTPGLLMRFGGYSTALTFQTAVGAKWKKYFMSIGLEGLLSLSTTSLFDSSINIHDAFGAAGSYARLSGSPSGLYYTLRGGAKVSRRMFIEAHFSKSTWGKRYPNFTQIGVNALTVFSFRDSIPKRRIRSRRFRRRRF